ncbi:MAG: flavin reductase family protein [Pseudodonghicola sp.]
MSDPAIDPMQLRRALGQFPTGVCIITCRVDGAPLGMTMSSFNSLSLDPPLVLFSIDRRAKGLPLWERAAGYAVHILAEGQAELSNRFARAGGEKWQGVEAGAGLYDAPLLSGAAARFECAAHQVVDGGDHRLFLARIERMRADPDRRPLVFAQGRYASLHKQDLPAPQWPLAIHY